MAPYRIAATARRAAVRLLIPAAAVAGALAVAGCGTDDSEDDATLVHGTTEQPVSYDPAGAWDLPSWTVIYNVHQLLLRIPPGATTPEPDAAKSCEPERETTYRCELRAGLRFSDGSRLTAEDVAFSFERVLAIADPAGPAPLFANLEEVRAPDERTVIFNLREPDATWPFRLATGGAAIVPSDSYPASALQPSDEVIGSGHYTLSSFERGHETVLEANPRYAGEDGPEMERVVVRYFEDPAALKLALLEGDVELAYRELTPSDVAELRDEAGERELEVVAAPGSEIGFLVFDLGLQPGDSEQRRLAIRRAVAYLIDRQLISKQVYQGTVEPLYSMVPRGVDLATEAFAEEYGRSPDPGAAREALEEAGVDTPVELEVWFTPSGFGSGASAEYAEIERQLEADDLFDVTLRSAEGPRYERAALGDTYPLFQFGWFPHFPDADNFTAPFYARTAFLDTGFSDREMDGLLADQRTAGEQSERAEPLDRIQEIGAELAPTIPVWQAKQVAGVRAGLTGVEETLDPSYQLRYWLIGEQD